MGTENKNNNNNIEALSVEEGPEAVLKGGPTHEYGPTSAHTIGHGQFDHFHLR